ncbi:hypothetical protein ABZ897_04420 [Nonomuraea sp. NPDC046802]
MRALTFWRAILAAFCAAAVAVLDVVAVVTALAVEVPAESLLVAA